MYAHTHLESKQSTGSQIYTYTRARLLRPGQDAIASPEKKKLQGVRGWLSNTKLLLFLVPLIFGLLFSIPYLYFCYLLMQLGKRQPCIMHLWS